MAFMNSLWASIFGGLGGMFGWGTSDFLANLSADRVGSRKTFFWSQAAGVCLVFLVCILRRPSFQLSLTEILLLLFLGVTYAIGYLLFYKGFELGNVSVVSAVINFQTVFIILISYFIRGQQLSALQIPALILIFFGVTFVSVNIKELASGTVSLLKGVKETLIAAFVFGVLFWPLNEYMVEQSNFLTVTLLIKLIALMVVLGMTFYQKQQLKVEAASKKIIALILSVGILEAVGVLSANFGGQYGDGILVAPISSSLTIVTVGLAMIFLKEKITRTQGVGIVMTIVGILLTAL